MYLVGLTGGIGSGKSTVARRLTELGVPVIDADRVAREIVEPGEPALDALVEHFGPQILRDDGGLDRSGLAAVVFADDEARHALDRLMHPRIAARIAERIAALVAGVEGGVPPLVVVDHPLLIETGQQGRFDAVVVVVAPEELRVRRLVEQRGLEEADARARIAVQCSDADRHRVASHVVDNRGGVEQLVAATDRLHEELLADAAEHH
ncbi:dephospho-CoA kinase [Egicoccus halophilus]|uniref:Dephospho-CoA kinase n=1 Tax=Egicoccus halophilus TaxID=1670830 RepID=A0A8J3A8T5_9ACTN|nr:dephospho-CoA kinase [Egicoccus halophilus]GGI04457.1 dephospho-CoA kinase [Egicoccus halophilus]